MVAEKMQKLKFLLYVLYLCYIKFYFDYFLLFYSKLTPTDQWCNMLRDFIWMEKYEEAMSDEHPLVIDEKPLTIFTKSLIIDIWLGFWIRLLNI